MRRCKRSGSRWPGRLPCASARRSASGRATISRHYREVLLSGLHSRTLNLDVIGLDFCLYLRAARVFSSCYKLRVTAGAGGQGGGAANNYDADTHNLPPNGHHPASPGCQQGRILTKVGCSFRCGHYQTGARTPRSKQQPRADCPERLGISQDQYRLVRAAVRLCRRIS